MRVEGGEDIRRGKKERREKEKRRKLNLSANIGGKVGKDRRKKGGREAGSD